MNTTLHTRMMALACAAAVLILIGPTASEARVPPSSGVSAAKLLRMRQAKRQTKVVVAAKTPSEAKAKDKASPKGAPLKTAPAPAPAPTPKATAPAGAASPVAEAIPTLSAEPPAGQALKTIEVPKESNPPFYERGWFWPIVGGVAAAIIVSIVIAESTGGDDRMPQGSLGTIGVLVP